MDLYKQIKQIALEAAKEYAAQMYYGTVLAASPLSVRVDQRFTLSSEFLAVTESLTELKYGDTVIRAGLAPGDKVLLINMGNSNYLVMDRVV